MELVNVEWTQTVNKLTVKCCGIEFHRPSNFSLVQCPICGKIEYWHGPYPLWDNRYQIMKNMVT